MILREIVDALAQANLDPSIKDFKLSHLTNDSHYTYTQDNQNEEEHYD